MLTMFLGWMHFQLHPVDVIHYSHVWNNSPSPGESINRNFTTHIS